MIPKRSREHLKMQIEAPLKSNTELLNNNKISSTNQSGYPGSWKSGKPLADSIRHPRLFWERHQRQPALPAARKEESCQKEEWRTERPHLQRKWRMPHVGNNNESLVAPLPEWRLKKSKWTPYFIWLRHLLLVINSILGAQKKKQNLTQKKTVGPINM